MSLLTEIQDEEYRALKYIAGICNENGLTFYLRGGSALGAVKYNDFIPWDDDIDIALPREDYLKLISLMPNEFDNDLLFVSYQKTGDAHCYFPRIVMNKTSQEKKGYPRNNERGLCLMDILPLDGMPNGKIKLFFHIMHAYVLRVLASLWTIDVSETVSMHGKKKDIILKILHFTRIHHLYKQNDIYAKLDKLYSKYPFLGTERSGMLSSDKIEKEIIPSSWWGYGTKSRFRDLEVLVPSNYDEYLKHLFGENYADYEPPDTERTKSHLYGKV